MPQVSFFSPAERQRHKERLRVHDAYALREGHLSYEDLRVRNGLFSSLEILGSSIVFQDNFA